MRKKVQDICFVICPFSVDVTDVYKRVYQPVIKEFNFGCIRADEMLGSRPIVDDIFKAISKSTIIIADMSGNNPNVYYEAGYATALNKPIIFITGGKFEDIPFDLRANRHIAYDKQKADWESRLANEVKKNIKEIIGTRGGHHCNIIDDVHRKYHEIGLDLGEIIARGSMYELSFVLWRLDKEGARIGGIRQSKLSIPAKDKYSYLRYVLKNILNCMGPKDHYRTLTNTDFWDKKFFGTGEFLNFNLDALKRGARIERVVFVDSAKIFSKTKNSLEYQSQLNQAITNFEIFEEQVTNENAIKNGKHKLRFFLSADEQNLRDTINNVPFAIMTNEGYKRGITMSTKNLGHKRNEPSIDLNLFDSDDKNLKGFISNFDDIMAKSISISKMKSIIR